jgi:hypothetical protein
LSQTETKPYAAVTLLSRVSGVRPGSDPIACTMDPICAGCC